MYQTGQQVIVSNNKYHYQQEFKISRFYIWKTASIMPPKVASSTAVSTATTNVVNSTKTYTMLIENISGICSFPFDSTVMDVIAQRGWAELSDVTTLTLTEVSDLMLSDDGTYWVKTLAHHLCKLK
jgi:hypothetical protein